MQAWVLYCIAFKCFLKKILKIFMFDTKNQFSRFPSKSDFT